MSRAHITAFYAENIKRLRVVRLEPAAGGGLVEIAGANGAGKSSVLDAIAYALLGARAVDPKPIRDGEESAVVSLTLGDVTVTRKFTANGGGSLTVTSAEGARFPSPQKMLDELVGASVLTFDPLAFDRMSERDQLEEVRKVAPLPPEVDAWRAERAALFAERTDVNREAKRLAGWLAQTPKPDGLTRAAVATVDAVLEKIKAAHEHNRKRDARAADVATMQGRAADLRGRADRLRLEAARLEAEAGDVEEIIKTMPPIGPAADVAGLERDLEDARAVEASAAAAEEWRRTEARRDDYERRARALTETIDALDARVAEAVAAAPMSVEGLRYGEDGLEFNGHPFRQASGAERLRVALGLAMAQRPGLRVVRIKDGSLLDANSLAIVAEMARAADFQVWIERVDTTGRVGVVIEDGEVARINSTGETDGQ